MDFDLAGRRALVTGSTSGIATAIVHVRYGINLAVSDHPPASQ